MSGKPSISLSRTGDEDDEMVSSDINEDEVENMKVDQVPNGASERTAPNASSHSTVSNTPTSHLSANATPRLNPLSTTSTTSSSLPPQNIRGKLLNSEPLPAPNRLLVAPAVSLPEGCPPDALDYIGNTDRERIYPTLPLTTATSTVKTELLLDAKTGRLKSHAEREKLFEEMELRVVVMRHKCGEIVGAARALQKACVGMFASNSTASSNGGENVARSNASLDGRPSINYTAGGGVKKRTGAANGIAADDKVKERLKLELDKLVQESRALRASLDTSSSAAMSGAAELTG